MRAIVISIGMVLILIVVASTALITRMIPTTERFTSRPEGTLSEGYRRYDSNRLGVHVIYPRGWESVEQQIVFTIQKRISTRHLVSFKPAPSEGTEGPTVHIGVENLPSDIESLDQYIALSIEANRQQYSDVQITTLRKTMIDGIDAQELSFEGAEGGIVFRAVGVYAIKNGKGYSVVYLAPTNSYFVYAQEAYSIMDRISVD